MTLSLPLGKGGYGLLANFSLCDVATSRSWHAQCVQAFLLKLAPFCKLSADLGSTNKSATSLFFFSDSCFVLSTLFSLLFSFYFILFGTSGRNYQFSRLCFLSDCKGSLITYFFLSDIFIGELARRGALLQPSTVLCSPFPLTSPIHSSLCFD